MALVPLLWVIPTLSLRQAFGHGYLAGAVAFLVIVSWIRVYGLPVWILLSAYLALYVGVFTWLYRWLSDGRSPWVRLWLAPVVWASLEYARSVGPFGFPWALVGLTQHAVLPVIQVARAAGVFGVSFVIVLGNAAMTSLLHRRALPVLIPAAAIVIAIGWGMRQSALQPVGTLRVAAVQPNIASLVKFDPVRAPAHLRALEDLVRTAAPTHPKLVIFPETVLPGNLFGSAGALSDVGRWAHDAQATLVISSLENGESNIAVSVAPSGQVLDRYDKVRLVAFGEAGIHPGTRHSPLWTPEGRVGVAICFESLFPDVAREVTRGGAEVLAVITNDAVIATSSWLDGTSGPRQHAVHSILRAVETGRWVIRAANTGWTMVIDPVGRVRVSIPPGDAGVLLSQVALERSPTWYVRWGDVFAQVVLLMLGLLAVPRLRPALAAEWRSSRFQHTAAAVLLPLVAVLALLRAGAPPRIWAIALLAFAGVFSVIRRSQAWGLHGRGFLSATVAGLGVILGLWVLMVTAYRAQHIPVGIVPPAGGWTAGLIVQLVTALSLEIWLRGVAFASLLEWKGRLAAAVVTTALGMLIQVGLPPEAIAWSLVTGLAFGLIRARTGNTAGLIIPHAVGNILVAAIFTVR